jgi:Cu(I)/Ag(I) efflux system membrane fusion protein
MKGSQIVAAAGFVGLMLFGLGWCGGAVQRAERRLAESAEPGTPGEAAVRWTCPMHPQIQVPEPVPCPLCGMALVPRSDEDDPGPRRLRISAADALLADIETAPVERRHVARSLRLVGELSFDETRVRSIASRVPGRLDRLFVDYTGIPVRRGDHLVEIYSPELFTAQQELLEARRRLDAAAAERSEFLAESDRRAYETAREKLGDWGMSAAWIDEVLVRGSAADRITIDAPVAGIVVHKAVSEGEYVQTGTRLYRIAEVDRLWARIAVFEKDLPWIRFGQAVALSVDALPGEVFEGLISFVDPVLDTASRTVRVRVQVDNRNGRLKPGMFVRANIEARLAQGGQVLDPRLAGKWISPMHPEVVKDGPGQCDVCGMDLVPAEELGYAPAEVDGRKPLVVPYTAVLPTGRRAVVYVRVEDGAKPTFEGREVVLGPRAGADQVILAGLAEHERVVVRGAFKIDSALQIQAKPSLLSAGPGGSSISGSRNPIFLASTEPLWSAYFGLQTALVGSDPAAASLAFDRVRKAAAEVRPGGLGLVEARAFEDELGEIRAAVAAAAAAGADLDALREAFHGLSDALIAVDQRFGHAGRRVHRETFCPMAFDDRGAHWLQLGDEVANPYFGDRMLRCGEFQRLLPGHGGPADPDLEAGGPGPVAPAPAPGAAAATFDLPAPLLGGLTAVFEAGIEVQRALAADGHEAAAEPLRATAAAADALGGRLDELEAAERELLAAGLGDVAKAARDGLAAADLAARRAAFEPLSTALLGLVGRYGHSAGTALTEAHCPMAFDDRGASWLQRGDEILNPYFGSEMLSCGTVEREFPARKD